MDAFAKYVGSRLKGGYEAAYLCHLKRGAIQVYMWKLAFKDGGEDLVALMALQEGKVGSLHFQQWMEGPAVLAGNGPRRYRASNE